MASSRHVGRPVHAQSCEMESLEGRALLSGTGLGHTFGGIPVSTTNDPGLPRSPDGDAATAVGDLALFAEGRQGRSDSPAVDVYDARQRQWTGAGVLFTARAGMVATTVNGRWAIFAGGATENGNYTDEVDVYDATTGQWSVSHLPAAGGLLGATAVGDDAVVFNGNVADVFDAAAGRWSTAPSARYHGGIVATAGGKAIFAGGRTIDVFDSTTGRWSTARSPSARRRAGMLTVTVDGLALFAGGVARNSRGRGELVDVVDVYNAATRRWSSASVPGIGGATAVTTVGDRVAVFYAGGKAFLYDAKAGRWTTSQGLPNPRMGVAAATVADRWAIFAGGDAGTGDAPSDAVNVYDGKTGRWSTATLGEARVVRTAVAVGDTAMFAWNVSGGDDAVDYFTA